MSPTGFSSASASARSREWCAGCAGSRAMRHIGLLVVTTVLLGSAGAGPKHDYPFSPVPFTTVRLDDSFWSKRLETNRTITIPFAFRQCESTGRVDNFAI